MVLSGKSFDRLPVFPSLWRATTSPPPSLTCLLSDVRRSQDTRCDRERRGALPPVLRGLAASEASRPVYLSVSSSSSSSSSSHPPPFPQKVPAAPIVAVAAPQQTPVVAAAPQAPAQAASQPTQPPQMGIASNPGGPIVSQVRSFPRLHTSPFAPPTCHPRGRRQALSHSRQRLPAVSPESTPQPPSQHRRLAQLAPAPRVSHMPTHVHTRAFKTSACRPKDAPTHQESGTHTHTDFQMQARMHIQNRRRGTGSHTQTLTSPYVFRPGSPLGPQFVAAGGLSGRGLRLLWLQRWLGSVLIPLPV